MNDRRLTTVAVVVLVLYAGTFGLAGADTGVPFDQVDGSTGTNGTTETTEAIDPNSSSTDAEATSEAETTGSSASSPSDGDTESGTTERTANADAASTGTGGTSAPDGAPGATPAQDDTGGTPAQGAVPAPGQGTTPAQGTAPAQQTPAQQATPTPAPGSDAEFEVVRSSTDAPIGDTGTLTVVIENTGEDAENAVVSLQSQSNALSFGGSASTSQFVGEWDEGDRETIEVDVTVASGVEPRSYPVQATVSYTDEDGNQVQSAPLSFGVTPEDEQAFSLDDVEGSLSVGSDGTIGGTITNDGPETATDAVLVFGGNASDVTPRQSEVVLGDVDPGESVDFEYPVTVAPGAAPGARQVPFVVQYRNDAGVTQRSETLNAQVTVDETQDEFAVTDVDSDLEPGEDGTVAVTLENTGEDVTDATVSIQSLSASVLFGETANTSQFVGEWDEGETETIEVQASAARGITEGEYPLQASVSYTDDENRPAQSGPVTFGVEVSESEDDFEIVSTSSSVPIGEQGTVAVTLENTDENVTEAVVSLGSASPNLAVGSTGNATRFVGEWAEGEQRTVTFEVSASNDSERRSYPVRTSVSYTNADGDPASSETRTFGVTPLREQSFGLANVSSNLSVGDEGVVTGTVVNQGPSVARNAVVTLSVDNENVNPQETEYAVGTLAAGESANVSFPIEVTDSAESGVRQLSFAVEYDNAEGDPRTSEALNAQVDVAPQRDEFEIDRYDATLDVGATRTVTVEVTNNRDSTVRNVNAQAFVDDPLSLGDDEAFVAELEPGESANVTFEISASENANPGTYPLTLDFQYDTADGETKLSDTYDVPIEVREPESGGFLSFVTGSPIGPVLIAVLLAVGIGWAWTRRSG